MLNRLTSRVDLPRFTKQCNISFYDLFTGREVVLLVLVEVSTKTFGFAAPVALNFDIDTAEAIPRYLDTNMRCDTCNKGRCSAYGDTCNNNTPKAMVTKSRFLYTDEWRFSRRLGPNSEGRLFLYTYLCYDFILLSSSTSELLHLP